MATEAVRSAGLDEGATSHPLRHRFAPLREGGADVRTAQELLCHERVEATKIDTHVLGKGGRGVTSPLDSM